MTSMAIAENASRKRCTHCLKYKSEFDVSFQLLLILNEKGIHLNRRTLIHLIRMIYFLVKDIISSNGL